MKKLIKARLPEKKSKSWKFLSKLVKNILQKTKRSFAAEKLNQAVASRTWRREKDKIDGRFKEDLLSHHFINNQWHTPEYMAEKLYQYFPLVGGTRAGEQSSCANLPIALSLVSYGEV